MSLPLGTSDYALWLVCAAFYVLDNLRLHRRRSLIIAESWSGLWEPLFPVATFRGNQRMLTVLMFAPPWGAAVEARWLRPSKETAGQVRRSRQELEEVGLIARPLGLLGTCVFLNLFVAAPLITLFLGLGYAVIWAVTVHACALSVLLVLLIHRRTLWAMTWAQVTAQMFECAVCPGFFSNVGRRVALRYGVFRGDALAYGYALAKRTSHAATWRLGQMLEEAEEEAEDLVEEERRYIACYRRRLISLALP
jgi:hypothetical protein